MSDASGPMHSPKTLPGIPVAAGAWPVIGHLQNMRKKTQDFLMQNTKELGPLFWINMGFGGWTVVVAGADAHEVMKNRKTSSDLLGEVSGQITAHSLIAVDGDEHSRMRGAMKASFTPRGIAAADVGAQIAEVMALHLADWTEGAQLSLLDRTGDIAIDVIFRIMGIPCDRLSKWREVFAEFINPGVILPFEVPGSPRWRSNRSKEWLDTELTQLIDAALEAEDKDSLLGALAQGADERGRTLTRKELLSNLRILALAGHETTASTMAWMMLAVGKDPALWQEIVEEAIAADGPPLNPKELADFPKAEALFRECLRLNPPLLLLPMRRVIEPLEVHGVTLPPQTRVSASLISLSLDPEAYPEPEKIRLDRWTKLGHKPRAAEAAQFGGGPHFCLGYHLAVLEGAQFIVQVARRLHSLGLKPVLEEEVPEPGYLPLQRPSAKARVALRAIAE